MRMPLQRRREANGTLPSIGSGSPCTWAFTASSVEVLPGELAAKRPERPPRTRPRRCPPPGTSATTRRASSVSVPVLSRQITSVDASDSTALSCWLRAPAARHPHRRHRVGHGHQQHEALRHDRDDAGHGGGHRLAERRVLLDERPAEQHAAGDHGDPQDQHQAVERQLQRGARVAELARLAHQALRVGVRADGLGDVRAGPLHGVRPGAHAGRPGRATPARPRRSGSTRPRRGPPPARAGRRPPPGRRRPPAPGRRGPRRRSATCTGRPSRTTVARGATSAASRSRLALARASWMIPMPAFSTRIARKTASRQSPKISVTMPKNSSVTLKTVNRLARRMLDHERLVGGGSTSPRAARRRLASAWLRPSAGGGMRCVVAVVRSAAPRRPSG